jgi:diguanylate cyclase (GGDEF)-like protein
MNSAQIAIWSACLGVYFSYTCLSAFYTAYDRSTTSSYTVLFVAAMGSSAFFLSGLAAHFLSPSAALWLPYAVLASGPAAGAVAVMGLRRFLKAEYRDTLVDRGMQFLAVLCVGQIALLVLPFSQAIEWIALLTLLCSLIAFWLVLRAWLLGDPYALPMAIACACLAFAVAGLYALCLGLLESNLLWQALTALFAAAYIVICCHTIKRRHTDYLRMRRALHSTRDRDLLTHLWTGAALVRKVDNAVARARRNRKQMAVICIEITNTGILRQEFGHNGVEQVTYAMAARIRSLSGASAVVGRYSDTSFVVIQDSVKHSKVLRTLGLRLAAGVRRPFMLNPYSSSPREFRADVGVGVARIGADAQISQRYKGENTHMGEFDSFTLAQDVLHEAAELAMTARQYASRAAVTDLYSNRTAALESSEV